MQQTHIEYDRPNLLATAETRRLGLSWLVSSVGLFCLLGFQNEKEKVMSRSIPRPMKCCTIPEGQEETYLKEMIKRNGYVLVSTKFDGYRCRSFYDYPWSSTGKLIRNRHIREEFKKAKLPDGLDGELIVDPFNFQITQSTITSYEGKSNFIFWVFDWVKKGPFVFRQEDYQKLMGELVLPQWCCGVTQFKMDNVDSILAHEKRILEAGHEGLIIKSPHSLYKHGRVSLSTFDQVKLLRLKYDEAEVEGFVEGEENTNELEYNHYGLAKRSSAQDGKVPNGSLGALVVRGTSGEHKGKVFRIGTFEGVTHLERKYIWDNQYAYLGVNLRYRWKQVGTDNLPRQPIFTSWLPLEV